MGKSRKKTPAVSSISYNGGKRRANKKVRRLLKDPEVNFDKGSFKKAYCSWDIRDYREVAPSFEVFSERWLERWKRNRARLGRRNPETPPTRKELWQAYQKWYLRK